MTRLRLLLSLITFLCLAPLGRGANQAVRGWCEDGGQTVVTSGLNSTTKVQRSFPQCQIQVFIHGGGAATIFSDVGGTPLANPFTAQTNGQWSFYAADSTHYDVVMTFPATPPLATPSPVTYSDIFLVASGGGGGGGTPSLPFNSVQYNNAGTFGGSASLLWDNTINDFR